MIKEQTVQIIIDDRESRSGLIDDFVEIDNVGETTAKNILEIVESEYKS